LAAMMMVTCYTGIAKCSAQLLSKYSKKQEFRQVINVVWNALVVTDLFTFASRDHLELHFTGSTHVFKDIWAKLEQTFTITKHTQNCWETGGKDFIIAHSSANPKQVATGLYVVHLNFKVKKCSEASRILLQKVYGQRLKNKLSLM
jgi:1-pyrroline-5-carboxylate dehydrogenase